ncbi:cytochrome P450 oxidoreductase, putative [Talaromyces stipitatus ATCC 10500]|uniref:Cytochrome P450 oxidoreductase, putative n=1 Tax=Talaromyces stipitatus (strain ATCC 10500 / CBS 375.48 / QM 6759 / NRRL 1006) TaxID=441959 RepID=B8LUA7_TALSN|nr:cytochrome P450 oxidoreductase, putative [Talaromyces stipitatus ATCC 10500]EED22579.1 cytochrome P450 oxidoreductase, putative [Talaromyces stipitatus ATCC 10500]
MDSMNIFPGYRQADSIVFIAVGSILGLSLLHLLRTYWRLRYIPGPFLARFTNLQRVYWVKTTRAHEIHQQMHEKYGNVVRFGPNMVSLGDPALIPSLYPIRPGFPKSDFYRSLMPYTRKGGSLPAVFNTRDENLHKVIKTPIAPLFSLSNILPLEVFVNRVLEVLFQQLDTRFVSSGDTFDLADWLQYFAFDVMGTLTFSKRYGFLEHGRDVNNMLLTIWTYMSNCAPMTQIPWFDVVWNKNAFITLFRRASGLSILGHVGELIADRRQRRNTPSAVSDEKASDRDMLSRFFELQEKDSKIPRWAVTAWAFSNVIAGSDSTAVTMRTTWFGLLSHPETLKTLRKELLDQDSKLEGGITRPFPAWKDICNLAYLDACVNEAVRLHPPFCLPFERVVPSGGLTIGGTYFPAGTVVGMSPWVINRHRPTFGHDAESWRPERWMVPEEHRRKLEQSVLTFGAGRRVCLGKHIAMLEIKKLTAALALNYEFDLLDPKRFKVENGWFFRQYGMDVKARKATVWEEDKKQ